MSDSNPGSMNAGYNSSGFGLLPYEPPPQPINNTPPAVDYSDAMLVQSNNSKTVAEAQIMTQSFALQQSAMDREMQNAANLEQGLANFDTKLQISKLDYFQAMKAESDHHLEKLASIASKASQTSDIPPPSNG